MGKKVFTRVLMCILVVAFSWVWSVQATALIAAVVASLNDVSITSVMIIVLTVICSAVGIFLVASGKMNVTSASGAGVALIVCNVYFVSLITITVLYMIVLGELKYTLLGEVALTWVLWFALMSVISNAKKRFSSENN